MYMSESDVVGVGLGPANLALATALLDAGDAHSASLPSVVFLERAASFAWHPGMQLPGSRLQVSFLKDLATQRNPRSRYTFLNYLFENGVIEEFINLREHTPEREEFSAYMAWVAEQAAEMVRFGCTVIDLRPICHRMGEVDRIEVVAKSSQDGSIYRYAANTVVLASGRAPAYPTGVQHEGAWRIIHTAEFRPRIEAMFRDTQAPLRFLVVGGGQSAAEAACYLLREYPNASVELCYRRFVLAAIDDNPLLNEAYFSRAVGEFHALDEGARQGALADLSMSNFGVVERQVLDELYRYRYRGIRTGRPRLALLRGHELTGAQQVAGQVVCQMRDLFSQASIERKVDGLILATGYRDTAPTLLASLERWFKRDSSGHYALGRDYRVLGSDNFKPAVFVHGSRELVHGPAEYNLSILALRAQIIFDAITQHLDRIRSPWNTDSMTASGVSPGTLP